MIVYYLYYWKVIKKQMSSLPIEVVLIILSFGTQIRMRNGKLMDQLQISEEHADLLSLIPQPTIPVQTVRNFRLVNFVSRVQLTNYLRIEKIYCIDADMYWWTLKRRWAETWASRPIAVVIHDLL